MAARGSFCCRSSDWRATHCCRTCRDLDPSPLFDHLPAPLRWPLAISALCDPPVAADHHVPCPHPPIVGFPARRFVDGRARAGGPCQASQDDGGRQATRGTTDSNLSFSSSFFFRAFLTYFAPHATSCDVRFSVTNLTHADWLLLSYCCHARFGASGQHGVAPGGRGRHSV